MLKSNTLKTTCYTILIAKHHQYLKKRYLYVHTNNYLMDDEWSPILCDCDGFLTSGQNRCPLPSTDLLSGHRASTLPWDLSPFKVNSLKITQGQTFCLFQNKSFWIFKRGLPFIRLLWLFFSKASRHKNDEFMIILAGVEKAESFVKRGKWQPIDDNHLMLDLRQGQDMWI